MGVSKEEFLKRAKDKFGDSFDYDLTGYKTFRKCKIKIFCGVKDHFNEAHGWFEAVPEIHLRGNGGCKSCQFSKGEYLCRDKRDFIYWADKFHNQAYDYSEFVYVNSRTKGVVKCQVNGHEPFLMNPNSHLTGKHGCPNCSNIKAGKAQSRTKNGGISLTSKLLTEGPKIHNHKFDYSLIDPDSELRQRDFTKIICPIHGVIDVQVYVHLAGHDCLQCANESNAIRRRSEQDKFISECKQKWGHPDEYYSKVNYVGLAYPITLVCPEHGDFECNSAKSHRRRGDGCPICSGNQKKDRAEVIRLCIEKHGEMYDYSKVEDEIDNVHEKITIICKIHGQFRQGAIGHYRTGYGCPNCGIIKNGLDNIKVFSRDETRAQSYCELYLVSVGEFWKIGISQDTYTRDDNYYDDYILILPSKRAEWWAAEQYLLMQTAWLEPRTLPDKYQNWPGRSELRMREMDENELVDYMESIMTEATELGWVAFARKHKLPDYGYGWDPESVL